MKLVVRTIEESNKLCVHQARIPAVWAVPPVPDMHAQPAGCEGYAARDVKDMGQQLGCHSLEWNCSLLGAPLTPKSMPPAGDEHAKLKT